jgi:hypothetical protein
MKSYYSNILKVSLNLRMTFLKERLKKNREIGYFGCLNLKYGPYSGSCCVFKHNFNN